MGQGRRDTNFTKDLEVTRMEQGLNAESPRRWMRCAESGGKIRSRAAAVVERTDGRMAF